MKIGLKQIYYIFGGSIIVVFLKSGIYLSKKPTMFKVQGKTRIIFMSIGALILLFLMWYFRSIVSYVLISLVLSFLGRPLKRWLTSLKYRKFKIPNGVAALITLIALFLAFAGFFWFMVPLVVKEMQTFSQLNFEQIINSVIEPVKKISNYINKEPVELDNQSFIDAMLMKLGEKVNFSKLSNILGYVAGTVGEIAVGVFSVVFITFFFLKDEKMFREGIMLLIPVELEEKVAHILDSIALLLRRYFIGLILELLMVMTLITIGLLIVGLQFNHSVIIGLLCGLLNIIPYIGPWIGALIGLIIGAALNVSFDFSTHTLPMLVYMTIVFVAVQMIDNMLFQPLIYSSSVKAHPLEIFFVFMIAGSVAGILGMILAVPVYTIIRVIAKEFFDNLKLVKKLTENLETHGGNL